MISYFPLSDAFIRVDPNDIIIFASGFDAEKKWKQKKPPMKNEKAIHMGGHIHQ